MDNKVKQEWDCGVGTDDEDHDWKLIRGDSSVGEGDYMECRQCGETRDATDDEVWDDRDNGIYGYDR